MNARMVTANVTRPTFGTPVSNDLRGKVQDLLRDVTPGDDGLLESHLYRLVLRLVLSGSKKVADEAAR